jgi:two-component system sensor histidine kinase VanS
MKEETADRAPGLSVRLKLALSYAAFLMLAGGLLLAAVWVFLLRYVPDQALIVPGSTGSTSIRGVFPVRSSLLHVFAPRAAAVLVLLLVFSLVGGWILAGRMLAPLARITDATRIATTGSLSHRIRLRGRRDEFRELADAFDAMLARLESHDAEQQRFAANASHELRTPLAVTQTLLDVARNDPNRDNGELVERLHAVNSRAIDLTEALLLLSRADQRSFSREHVDLSLMAEEATETLLPIAEQHRVTIKTSGEVTPTVGSHALLLQMTMNLVHNAIVHNLPEQGTVWVTTSVHPESVVLTVENTGEKLPPQLVSTFGEPFQRSTKRIRTDHAGVGLGLAIVKSITRAHNGTLTLTPRPGGGLRVTAQLPATPLHTSSSASDPPSPARARRVIDQGAGTREPGHAT